ncbi:arylsulfatase [Cupriavidus taiwanensis]|uniref:arylsulfatase n=1 Tax=Cupriavidus taiwanensis TaxID=164546 RepID=UPI000688E9A5|nr:arylsulfatase [Cupriavidus taiwanensis]SOZ10964.1 arylsulfatase precursor [Cupriavidus taiwanensis]
MTTNRVVSSRIERRAPQRHLLAAVCLGALALAGCGSDDGRAPNGDESSTTQPTQPQAAKRPNILFIMADDLGYSDLGAFGSEIRTPNLDKLVGDGRLLTNHHTSTVCAVTRSMIISGTDHHLVGQGTMANTDANYIDENGKPIPGYEGYLNDRALSIAQLLKDGGYHTYMAGKWHLGSGLPNGTNQGTAVGATAPGQTPVSWGFEKSYALLGGGGDHFGRNGPTAYVEDDHYVTPNTTNFYSTDFYTSTILRYIDSSTGKNADGKPFFAYLTYQAPHSPLQAPAAYLDRYKGVYDAGYEPIRAARLARQKALGLIPADFTPNPGRDETLAVTPATPGWGTAQASYVSATRSVAQGGVDTRVMNANKKWDSLSADEKKAQARYMEIYAAMVENLDDNIGRLVQHLKDIGEYDNTLIVFQSDNGPEASYYEFGGKYDQSYNLRNADPAVFPTLGTRDYKGHANLDYGQRWAEVSATPFKLWKSFPSEGGHSVPTIVKLPGAVPATSAAAQPKVTAFTHVVDLAPTFLDLAGISAPSTPAAPLYDSKGVDRNAGKVVYDGRNVYPISGVSLLPTLLGKTEATGRTTFAEELYGRTYVYSDNWKAVWIEPPFGPAHGEWTLYDIRADRGETNDLAVQRPDVLADLKAKWNDYAARVGAVLPKVPGMIY